MTTVTIHPIKTSPPSARILRRFKSHGHSAHLELPACSGSYGHVVAARTRLGVPSPQQAAPLSAGGAVAGRRQVGDERLGVGGGAERGVRLPVDVLGAVQVVSDPADKGEGIHLRRGMKE